MNLSIDTTSHGFAIESREDLPEIDGVAYIGRHEASGARLLYLQNDDNNKSFAIGFRTPPKDDTGVFHILEHSVLCGSRRFPVKEPFVDLLKGSMQTFLNAMTFADKTLYPVASTNEQDLLNLMDVYLDAVFHPNIYEKRAVFEQEGWHYELRANEGDGNPAEMPADQTTLTHNGVVFNEMKGVLSDANSVLYNELQAGLFTGTCYAFESGGTPQAIPTLTYEGYLDEHRRHYRADNSYVILYGNMDIDRVLAFIDERYLTPVAAEQQAADLERADAGLELLLPREITTAQPGCADGQGEGSQTADGQMFVEMPQLSDRCGGSRTERHVVPVPEGITLPDSMPRAKTQTQAQPQAQPGMTVRTKTMDTAPENACAGCAYVVGDSLDRLRALAADILVDALFGSNEAPLTRALLDAQIAHDVNAFVSDAVCQPFVVVQVSMPIDDGGKRLPSAIEENVRKLLDAGLDKKLVEAALSHAEFQMREHDMGYPDGVIYAMTSLSSWLYDEDAPLENLRYERAFAQLREALEGDFYERLCAELFLENKHTTAVEIVPTPGVSDDDSAERLAEMNRTLSPEERKQLVEGEERLRELQMTPDTPEAIATLPRLSVADIGEAPDEPAYAIDEDAPLTCLRHRMPTRGIAYAYRYFDMGRIPFEELPYVSVLAMTLGKLGTARHTAAELDTLTQEKLGNLAFFSSVIERLATREQPWVKFVVSSSALSHNTSWLATLPREVMLETDFTDTARILDLLKQHKIILEQGFANSGHSCAITRVRSYSSPTGVLREQLSNVDFYRFLCDLIEHFDERANELTSRLAGLAARIFCDDNCHISFAGSDSEYSAFWNAAPELGRKQTGDGLLVIPEPIMAREAFIVPSDVCFSALGYDRRLIDEAYSGTWEVAARALTLNYLWNEVRVKGGAYGVGFKALQQGDTRFHSYRDPHLDETIERFEQAVPWLESFSPSREDMEGLVVSCVAGIDAPTKPRMLLRRQTGDFFCGRTPEDRVVKRRQIVETDPAAIRALSSTLAEVVEPHAICAFGNREILENSKLDLELIPLVG